MESFPDEILLVIFDMVAPPITSLTSPHLHQDAYYFALLCRVSHRFRRIGTPLLYRSIERPPNAEEPMCKFLRTVQQVPTLKDHIKYIRLSEPPNFHHYLESAPLQEILHSLPLRTIRSLATQLHLPDPDEICSRYIRVGDDILLALATFMAPKLEKLVVDFPSYAHYEYSRSEYAPPLIEAICRMALGETLGHVHNFKSLRVLHINNTGGAGLPITWTLPLLLLPQLRDLSLYSWDEGITHQVYGHVWTWPRRTSPIRRLSLIRPSVRPLFISDFIEACEALTSFECTEPQGRFLEWFSYISDALKAHSESLETLSVTTSWIAHGRNFHLTGNDSWGRLPCIANLANLKNLRVPFYFFFSNEPIGASIPSALESLTFDFRTNGRPQDANPLFAGILDACSHKPLSSLKNIRVFILLRHYKFPLPIDCTKFITVFKAQGIRLDVMVSCLSGRVPPGKDTMQKFEEIFPEHCAIIHNPSTWAPALKASTWADHRSKEEIQRDMANGYLM